MFTTTSQKKKNFEGPYLQWKGGNELLLTYLTKESVENFKVPVEPGEQLLEVPGQLEDHHLTYRIRRSPEPPKAEQEGVEKILILGDMHGMYRKLYNYLLHNKVIDEEGHWNWGRGHLVMCGDVLDRGDEVTETLWLLYQLEQEAAEAGGAVHYLLGNHEQMVMEGDLRYVNRKYMHLFHERKIPYQSQFNKDTVFGQWLRSRNTAIRLNDLLISHAGISPFVAQQGMSLSEINSRMQEYRQEGHRDRLTELLIGQQGPLWFRGYVLPGYGTGTISQEQVERLLQQYNSSHMVVAHTTVPSVQSRFNGKVFAVDLDVNDPQLPLEGLLFTQGKFFRLMDNGRSVEL